MIVASQGSTWAEVFDKPLRERLGPAPDEVVKHIALVNACRDDLHASVASAGPELLAAIRQALDEIPAVVTARLEQSLLGVYFATGLGSSGVTDIVVSPDSAFLGLVIVLDLDAIANRGTNAWATWREASPFEPSDALSLEIRIAEGDGDNLKNAIQFLLLHEMGHAFGTGRKFLPDWWAGLPQGASDDDYHFLPISWHIDAERRIVPLPDNDFPLRANLAYYGYGPLLPAERMVELYSALRHTGFPTLYAAVSVDEDFAESFACYVHTVLLNKPLSVSISEHGEQVLHWRMDWRDERFADKYAFLRRLLGDGVEA